MTQSSEIQELVRNFVDSGQLEFVYETLMISMVCVCDFVCEILIFDVCFGCRNGGWCMHDEAATHYIDMIDQTTLGHRVIKQNFNKTPRAGWQIDPFGHSAVQAYLLSAEVRLVC